MVDPASKPPPAAAKAPALTVDEAIARVCGDAAPLPSESVSLLAAHGRVLAAPVEAMLTAPPFDASKRRRP